MTVYKKPITWSKISQITGIGTKELGLMITAGYINANSLHKPVRLNTWMPLTEEQRKSVNYGYGIIEYNSYAKMVQGYNNGDKWQYLRPRGLYFATSTNEPPEPFRPQDFDGYDSEAKSPFEMRTEGNPRIGENLRLLFLIEPKELTTWGMWSDFQGANMANLQMGVYVPGIGYYPIIYGSLRLDDLDYDPDKGLQVPISSSAGFSAGTTYSAYIVLTTWDVSTQNWYQPSINEGDSGYRWWIINVEGTQPLEFTVQGEYNAMESIGGGSLTNGVTTYAPTTDFQERYINTSFDYQITNNNYDQGNPYIDVRFVAPRVWPGYGTQVSDKEIGHLTKYNFTKGVTASIQIDYPDELLFLASKDEGVIKIEARIRLVQPSANDGGDLIGQRIELFEIYAE